MALNTRVLGRRRGRQQNGTSMIEMAIVMPVLVLLLLGTMEMGLMFSRYQILLSSAREGARIASLHRDKCNRRRVKSEVDQIVTANGTQLGMLLLPTNVKLSGACSDDNVEVRIKYRHFITGVEGAMEFYEGGTGSISVPMNVRVVMRREN